MRAYLRPLLVGSVLTAAVLVWPASLFAQTFAGLSLGAGVASVGTEGTPWTTAPFVASIRAEFTRFLAVEVEWMQPIRATRLFDTGDLGLATLNGQSGIYGRETSRDDYKLGMTNMVVLARARMNRVSFQGGAGIGRYTSFQETVRTRTGCTGPWIPACQSGNQHFIEDRTGNALVILGGMDVNIVPRLDAFVSGRLGGHNSFEEAAVAFGLRTALLPGRVRQSSDRRDSVLKGLVIGLAGGAGMGMWIASYDEPRALPASVVIGGAVGAIVDAIFSRRR